MYKNKTNLTVQIGKISFILLFLLFWIDITVALFEAQYLILTIFAIYSIINIVLWCNLINSKKEILKVALGFIIVEFVLIIPNILILFIKGMI